MTDQVQYSFDPWIKSEENQGDAPPGARHVCTYLLYIQVDSIEETVRFIRRDGRDELWVDLDGLQKGRAIHGKALGTEDDAVQRMLAELILSRVGFGWPEKLVDAGLVDDAVFKAIVLTAEAELETIKSLADKSQSLIVRTAKTLKLGPEPSCKSSTSWSARCPETNHSLALSSKTDEFGCGYCRRRGGPKELEELFAERKELQKKRT